MGLVTLNELPREGASWTGEVVAIGLNPSILDSAEVGTLPGYNGPCVVLKMPERVLYIEGDVLSVIETINEASKVHIHADESPEHIVSLEQTRNDSATC